MLCFTRRKDEQVRIGPNVIMTILSVEAGRVRMGFEAPPEVAIHREEYWQKVAKFHRERNNKEA